VNVAPALGAPGLRAGYRLVAGHTRGVLRSGISRPGMN